MKAWFARHYGGPEVLRLEEIPMPAPKPGEVLVRIHATTVNSGDVRIRGCNLPPGMKLLGRLALGWNGPRQPVLGTEFSGVVEAVGQGVTRFGKGDAVYAFAGMRQGAHAQFATSPESGAIAHLPEGLDFHTAAALSFGGTTALHYLRKAALQRGETMLVLGGSGAVGVAMVQLATHRGATVTATTSTGNVPLVAALGAAVIDYTQIDVATLPDRYDIVADTVGALDFARAQPLLKSNGRYLAISGAMKEMLQSLRPGPDGKRMIAGPASERADDVMELGRLAAAGHFRPYIDRVFAFVDLPAAHAHVDTGRKRGSVVIAVAE
ncbi:NAD(P)-dependent alcohol dehydrogenase [Devosia sediminis]|uniref:NAD(P)-dependent alcohol dehydrogenase n=1 Tax=Devosia sediminis TaxID=2798801 RepID=A0A934MK84_9HYPH|nr:NAD(P)-dependent alcohol dehydrogenase [Devosia sediminis]MBJ3784863.1 NAD(P)-dependent alcohol dehydrogenase [Devosia sediminis]